MAKPPIEYRPKRIPIVEFKYPLNQKKAGEMLYTKTVTRAELEATYGPAEEELDRRKALKAAQMRRYRARLKANAPSKPLP